MPTAFPQVTRPGLRYYLANRYQAPRNLMIRSGARELVLLVPTSSGQLQKGANTHCQWQPQICRISITERLGRAQIKNRGHTYPYKDVTTASDRDD